MRLHIILLITVIALICLTEAGKKERRRKKQKLAGLDLDDNNNKANDKDDFDDIDEEETDADLDNKSRSRYSKKYKKKYSKKGKFDHKNQLSWLSIKKDSDCNIKCSKGSVCIIGPVDDKPLCVNKKDLKKSLKLFHRYQKQEMKAWKQFKKIRYNHDEAERYPLAASNEKTAVDVSIEMDDIKKLEMQKPAKTGKQLPNNDDNEACTNKQFSQMRTRMMGWFHLLHGQDHQARQQHGGSIKHFYKHVSVKKELREYDGQKCECLKSAMWQFHQMDKNSDDKLNYTEMSLLEENSMEPCMKRYLSSCDQDADSQLSSNEWCCCFSNVVAPCYKKVDEIMKSGEPVTFKPRCDREGYYMREQCTNENDGAYQCWCVDYNGNNVKGTRTSGRAHCSKIAMNGVQVVKKS